MLRNLFSRFARDERGVTLVEYGIAVVLAVIVGVGGLTLLGNTVNGELEDAAQVMDPSATIQ
jgi:Flp pilus assembly pilin Flp